VVDQHEGSACLANFPHGVQAGTSGADDGNVGLDFRFHGKRLSVAVSKFEDYTWLQFRPFFRVDRRST
jgi:hypothetical protein